ncbi:MAG: hypothetical protein ABIG63_11395 [Chloroflexota bacterium]
MYYENEIEFLQAERRRMEQEYWRGVVNEYASLRQQAEREGSKELACCSFEVFCAEHGYVNPEEWKARY